MGVGDNFPLPTLFFYSSSTLTLVLSAHGYRSPHDVFQMPRLSEHKSLLLLLQSFASFTRTPAHCLVKVTLPWPCRLPGSNPMKQLPFPWTQGLPLFPVGTTVSDCICMLHARKHAQYVRRIYCMSCCFVYLGVCGCFQVCLKLCPVVAYSKISHTRTHAGMHVSARLNSNSNFVV